MPQPNRDRRRTAAATALALAVLLPCCASEPLGIRAAPTRLVVENPEGLAYGLEAVHGDVWTPIAGPVRAARATYVLLPGAYVVRAETAAGPLALPAPLFDAVLDGERTVRVRLATPPAQPPDVARGFVFVP